MNYRQRVYEFCQDSNGLLTTKEAQLIGVPAVELRKLTQRGALERVGHGTYRITHFPHVENLSTLEVLKMVGPEAYVIGESVLSLLDLGVFNPRKLHIATSKRVRKQLPSFVMMHKAPVADVETELYHQIRCKKVPEVFKDLVGQAISDRLLAAAIQAQEQNYLSAIELKLIVGLIAGTKSNNESPSTAA